jgi:hypothetical protein
MNKILEYLNKEEHEQVSKLKLIAKETKKLQDIYNSHPTEHKQRELTKLQIDYGFTTGKLQQIWEIKRKISQIQTSIREEVEKRMKDDLSSS